MKIRNAKNEKEEARPPKLGTMKGKAWVKDPDWWKPMTEEETEAFLEGRQ